MGAGKTHGIVPEIWKLVAVVSFDDIMLYCSGVAPDGMLDVVVNSLCSLEMLRVPHADAMPPLLLVLCRRTSGSGNPDNAPTRQRRTKKMQLLTQCCERRASEWLQRCNFDGSTRRKITHIVAGRLRNLVRKRVDQWQKAEAVLCRGDSSIVDKFIIVVDSGVGRRYEAQQTKPTLWFACGIVRHFATTT